jgi:hypothetical protein
VANLATSELVPHGDRWRAAQLLVVPPPVLALSEGQPTELGKLGGKSEA